MNRISLPIDPILPQALSLLERQNSLVVQATPGSGKTTRLPPALLGAQFLKANRDILVLEPRRLAAKYAALRVAQELGETVGETVGYHFRFEKVESAATRLRFLTEGMLMRRLLHEPTLRGVGAVILDEFHERHLHGDLALGYLRRLQATTRPDLRIVIMSATLDVESVTVFLDNCPSLNVESRIFPIEYTFLAKPPEKYLEHLIKDAVRAELENAGDILVFLPGMSEIRRAAEMLSGLRPPRELEIHVLHGELSREAQDRAIQPSERRKVILSTNVAETSLTIEGVRIVIDSGLHRQASYSWWSGVPALRTRPTSKASAIQRAGRAGRMGPGRCRRLYTKSDFEGRAQYEIPEIRRADLTQTLLELKALGVADIGAFPWFEKPAELSLQAAEKLLTRLGALDGDRLTEMGKRLSQIPAHPRISRMLCEAFKRGVLYEAASLAALISEGKLDRVDAIEQSFFSLDEMAKRSRQQMIQAFAKNPFSAAADKKRDEIAFSVLTGFPDRVGKKRKLDSAINRTKAHEVEVLLSAGGTAVVENTGVISESDTFVALDIQEQQGAGQAKARVRLRSVCAIRPEWLFDLEPAIVEERELLEWDSHKQCVVALSQLAYDQIVLTESTSAPKDSAGATRLLMKSGLGIDLARNPTPDLHQWLDAFAKFSDRESLESALGRISLLAKEKPDVLNAVTAENLGTQMQAVLEGKTSLRELKELNWPEEILQHFSAGQYHRLGQLLPLQFTFPNGKSAKINYALDKPPWLESRLNDFFGLAEGPSLLGKKVPLTLHLLAPNYRAVQVTSDLVGFWKRTYPEVRKELSRRYPRHAWPENPMVVPPPRPKRVRT